MSLPEHITKAAILKSYFNRIWCAISFLSLVLLDLFFLIIIIYISKVIHFRTLAVIIIICQNTYLDTK